MYYACIRYKYNIEQRGDRKMTLSIEAIRNRVSVRTFDKKIVSESTIGEIDKYINQLKNPFQMPFYQSSQQATQFLNLTTLQIV